MELPSFVCLYYGPGGKICIVWNRKKKTKKGPCRNADEDDAHDGSRTGPNWQLKQSAGEGNKSREGPRAKEYPLKAPGRLAVSGRYIAPIGLCV